ncbi:DUF5995 family protein [Solwaraspora sp. WMMD792]|uniref:DUF5995 family protein n=1 Tax=unclassified Solwaraspora TaxID=2627926 RepID=UPI002416B8F8|nr:DUF5995 family protein [Solwaraspora sp. WMMD792]MDG4773579.1 DUF5995 family protein [Solwaraspora sp. WMMD792]
MPELRWGHVHDQIMEVLDHRPTDVAGVVEDLAALQKLLEAATPSDSDNPVADFNHLYWVITSTIDERLQAGEFADPAFLTLLDIEFAERYFAALRCWGNRGDTPAAWEVLFSRLRDESVRSLPSAAAGVNAHINYDLPFALLSTWAKLGSGPDNDEQHRDYLYINEIFFDRIPQLRRSYLSSWQICLDRLNGQVDDWYQNRLVEFTRDIAWRDAARMWPMRDNPTMLESERLRMDRHTAFLGWALLSPVGSLLQ